jgi:hypothetical protein
MNALYLSIAEEMHRRRRYGGSEIEYANTTFSENPSFYTKIGPIRLKVTVF